jgi:hypothetical protein
LQEDLPEANLNVSVSPRTVVEWSAVDWRRFTPENFEYGSEAWQHRSDYYRLAVMKTKKTSALSQEAIDRHVVKQSENDSAWEAPMRVKRSKPASLSIPGDLAAWAAFLARLHREADLKSWVERVLRDRVELEESAFAEAKKNLTP